MEDRTLCALIEQEVSAAIGHWTGGNLAAGISGRTTRGSLANERAMELDYYNGQPFGNEVDGESQVVSTDVFDTVEGMLPALLRIFTASDDVVHFDPNGPEDEPGAQQQTEVANYVFYRQNNGFLILYEWFKDALIQKNGVVKYWWEEKTDRVKESFEGLSEVQYRQLTEDENVEELEHTAYPDPTAEERKKQLLLQQQLPPEAIAQIQAMPIPELHDVTVRIAKDRSKICIEVVPPEEFGISALHKCISIQDTAFCYHRTRTTVSKLREQGCPEEVIANIGGGDEDSRDLGVEALARDRFIDEYAFPATEIEKQVWITDCFYRVDDDGDGIAELRHIVKAGNAIWINEETDHINFAALTPIIMPHRWVGRSVAELVMSDQFTKSVLQREMLNNLYLTNRPRKVVLSSSSGVVQANLDDLMTSRVGGIIREYVPNAVRQEETPFVAGAAFPMLEYIDRQKEARTSVTPYNQGTDADALNKTARGISIIQNASEQRKDLIARIFAETGVKDLMRGIVYMLSKYSTKAMTVRLRNKWVDVDPREWKTQFDMTVNVGLGTGNKDAQLAHLNAMGMQQMELMKTGKGYMVSDDNVYNLYKKQAEAMGFKHPELFVTDPNTIPEQKKQPPPPPEVLKIQSENQQAQAKIASSEKIRQFDAQREKDIEGLKSQTLIAVAHINAEKDRQIEEMRLKHQAHLAIYQSHHTLGEQAKIEADQRFSAMERNFNAWKEELQASTKILVAQIAAKAGLEQAALAAEAAADRNAGASLQ